MRRQPAARATCAARSPQLAGKRLLVVDDNATNRRILTLQAEAWGMRCARPIRRRSAEWLAPGEPFRSRRAGYADAGHGRRAAGDSDPQVAGAGTLPLVLLTSLGRRRKNGWRPIFSRPALTKPIKAAQLYDALSGIIGGFAHQRGARTTPVARRSTPPWPSGCRCGILLAEDNVVNQKVALRTLERLGYRADVAANGIEVLDGAGAPAL